MPRRRMIDPLFWDDRKVGKLSRDERSFIVGCVGHADDEGRLQGDPAFLKSQIFKYDKDLDDTAVQKLRDTCLEKMQSWPAIHPYRMALYSSSDEEYICFPNWAATNRPSHATKSQLPAPPPEALPMLSSKPQEAGTTASREAQDTSTKPSALGQSSLGKVSIGKSSGVLDDFTKIEDDNDLTDLLTTTLEKYAPRGGVWLAEVLKKFWVDRTQEKIPGTVFQVTVAATRKYPIPILAMAFVKAVRYTPGKTSPANYLKKILEEKSQEHARSP